MKTKQFDKLVVDTVEKCQELLALKGAEYAHGDDRLDNFKRNAEELGLLPEEVWAVYYRKHHDAITTMITDLRKGVDRQRSESILGRFDDAINYLLLGKALIIDRQNEQK